MNRIDRIFGLALGYVLLGSLSAQAETWVPMIQCENNSVRLETALTAPYRREMQLVIHHEIGIDRLLKSGAIRESDLNDRGELVLHSLKSLNGAWAVVGALPRDEGAIVYKIDSSFENRKMIFTAAYTNIPPYAYLRAGAPYITPFTGIEFYGCQY
jgi:hypothetical protein